jgi:hypothetical protein
VAVLAGGAFDLAEKRHPQSESVSEVATFVRCSFEDDTPSSVGLQSFEDRLHRWPDVILKATGEIDRERGTGRGDAFRLLGPTSFTIDPALLDLIDRSERVVAAHGLAPISLAGQMVSSSIAEATLRATLDLSTVPSVDRFSMSKRRCNFLVLRRRLPNPRPLSVDLLCSCCAHCRSWSLP